MYAKFLVIISLFAIFISGCNHPQENDNPNSIQSKYNELGIRKVKKSYRSPKSTSLKYTLNLYENGFTKDSAVHTEYTNTSEVTDILQTFYEDGSEDILYTEKVHDPNQYFRPVYEYEGKNFTIRSISSEWKRDESGRTLYEKTLYNDTHKIETRYVYTDSTKIKTKLGPIGDIISSIKYILDQHGNEIGAYNVLENRVEEQGEYSAEKTIFHDSIKWYIDIYRSEDFSSLNSCRVTVTDTIDFQTVKITNCDCPFGLSVEDVEKTILDGKPLLYVRTYEEKLFDVVGSKIKSITREGNTDSIISQSHYQLIYDDMDRIVQKNSLNEEGEITYKRVYVFNDTGELVEEKIINIKENKISLTEYIFDENNILTTEKHIVDGVHKYSYVYEYE
jgi:hypothetical protein